MSIYQYNYYFVLISRVAFSCDFQLPWLLANFF